MSNRRNRTKNRTPRWPRVPKPQPGTSVYGSYDARVSTNWRVKQLDHCVIALEPGREHDQVFSGGDDPYWQAVEYAASCLRGETDPAALF